MPCRQINASVLMLVLLPLFTFLISVGAWRHSPTFDEPAHLVAGWSHWELGRFDLYRVNPPLIRVIAVLPLRMLAAAPEIDLKGYSRHSASRSEFSLGQRFLENDTSLAMIRLARWSCMPFGLLGACICYTWAHEMYGSRSGLLAASLWCFSPTILGHAQLITPDVGAASLGCAAAYSFWRWLRFPSWGRAVWAGVVLGLAALTKSTLILLFPLWPILWLAYRKRLRPNLWQETKRLCCLLLLGLYVVNAGYAFEGSFTQLDDYQFVSRTLGGDEQFFEGTTTGNRFSGTWLGALVVPLPQNYLLGMDVQRREFEERKWSYLRGEWRLGGWWYYYLYGLLVKEPLGLWGLAGIALLRRPSVTSKDELILVGPMMLVLVLVSSQTGFNHHYRYVLPALPFIFILVSRVVANPRINATGTCWHLVRSLLVGVLIIWFALSSLFVYPHSLSYFNEIAGGPLGGPKHLLGSSTDWGQDLFYLREWLDEHPEVDDFCLAWTATLIDPALIDIHVARPPSLVQCQANLEHDPSANGTKRRWYLLSVNELYQNNDRYAYFREMDPTTTIGYTLYVYHASLYDICESVETSVEE